MVWIVRPCTCSIRTAFVRVTLHINSQDSSGSNFCQICTSIPYVIYTRRWTDFVSLLDSKSTLQRLLLEKIIMHTFHNPNNLTHTLSVTIVLSTELHYSRYTWTKMIYKKFLWIVERSLTLLMTNYYCCC